MSYDDDDDPPADERPASRRRLPQAAALVLLGIAVGVPLALAFCREPEPELPPGIYPPPAGAPGERAAGTTELRPGGIRDAAPEAE